MLSPLLIPFVLLIVHCSTVVCTFLNVGVGDVTSLLAVLNGDWTHVNIYIMDVMGFV